MTGALAKEIGVELEEANVDRINDFMNPAVIDEAYELACKGVTIYRDGSKENQVLSFSQAHKSINKFTKKHWPVVFFHVNFFFDFISMSQGIGLLVSVVALILLIKFYRSADDNY